MVGELGGRSWMELVTLYPQRWAGAGDIVSTEVGRSWMELVTYPQLVQYRIPASEWSHTMWVRLPCSWT